MQYQEGVSYQEPKRFDKKQLAVIALAAVIVIFAVSFILLPGEEEEAPKTAECGNDICDAEENCYECPLDCKCGEGEYCSATDLMCVSPECGNGQCESFESPETCCPDCGCTIPGEICDEDTESCEMQEMSISDERAIELAESYILTAGKTIESSEILKIGTYEGELVKIVRTKTNEDEWYTYLGVKDSEEIVELNFL